MSGWDQSAEAWLAEQGDEGDWGRRFVLDRIMLERVLAVAPRTALDVGCGEGRFCRILSAEGIKTTGIEPTPRLRQAAIERHPNGAYIDAFAEHLPLDDASYDLVVSYLSLIDIPDFRAAISEMARVLAPGGRLLIANLTSFNTAGMGTGWIDGPNGQRFFPIDHYLEEAPEDVAWRGIEIVNWHRPLSTYMQALLGAGLQLTYFDEPAPAGFPPEDATKADRYRRVPYFLVMEWAKPTGDNHVS